MLHEVESIFSEHCSEKIGRGRPRLMEPEAEAAYRSIWGSDLTQRTILNRRSMSRALAVLGATGDVDDPYVWLFDVNGAGVIRKTILVELGRVADVETMRALADSIVAERPSTSRAVAAIRRRSSPQGSRHLRPANRRDLGDRQRLPRSLPPNSAQDRPRRAGRGGLGRERHHGCSRGGRVLMIGPPCRTCGKPFVPTRDDITAAPDVYRRCPGCRSGGSGDELMGLVARHKTGVVA